jgi:hypothetical protein
VGDVTGNEEDYLKQPQPDKYYPKIVKAVDAVAVTKLVARRCFSMGLLERWM